MLGFSEKLFLREELAPPVSTYQIFSDLRYVSYGELYVATKNILIWVCKKSANSVQRQITGPNLHASIDRH